MAKRSSTDKAIRHIMDWSARPEWVDAHADVTDDHLGPVCDRMGITREELSKELEEHGYEHMLFGVMFEDMLGRDFPPDGRNVIDDYLQHRGWRESVPGRSYLRALRKSVLSLYEVVGLTPGRHCDLQDLVRGGKPFRVFEQSGTQSMVKWDRIAARVMKLNGRNIFSGGILPFTQPAAQSLLRVLEDSRTGLRKILVKAGGQKAVDEMASSGEFDQELLQESCPAFTSIWLMHTLEQLRAPLPEIVNRDGQPLMFTETHFPLLTEDPEEITRRLEEAADWERDGPDKPTWTWSPASGIETGETAQSASAGAEEFSQRLIHGWLELQPSKLVFSTNSTERAEQGEKALEALLQELIGHPLTQLQTPEQMIEGDLGHQPNADGGDHDADALDPELAAEIIQKHLDDHYRKCLDEPIPMLDGKSPRQCAQSKKGRGQVIEWLKYLENSELRRAADQGQKPYDSRWMWEELNLP